MRPALVIVVLVILGGFGIYYFGLRPFLGRTNVMRVENQQLLEQVRLLREQVNIQERAQQESSKNLEPKKRVFAPKESFGADNLYQLDCFTSATQSAKAANLFKIASAKGTKGEKVQQVCEKQESLELVFVAFEPNKERPEYGKLSYRLLDEKGRLSLLASRGTGVYLNCGNFLFWTKGGGLYFKCGGGDGAGGYSQTVRLDLSNGISGVKEEVSKACQFFDGVESCTTSCSQSSDCKRGEFCNLETRSCVKSCQEYSDCGMGTGYDSCVPMGPVRGCQVD